MKKGNPFTLTFGKTPNEYISRYETTHTIISTFEAENPVSQIYLIEGIRGSGKTVLMTTVTKELADKEEWIVIDLNSTQDLIRDFALRLSDTCKKIPDLMKAGFNVSIAGFGVGINGGNSDYDHVSIIEEVLTSLKEKSKKVIVTIDEVMHDQNMKYFASEFQILLRKDYPVFLLMTGLYENIYAVQNDPALTFLLRTPKIRLEPLSIPQIARQYQYIFKTDKETAKELAEITKGYAFAFQALGMLYYEFWDSETLDEILVKLDDMLEDFVYKKIWETLSAQDKRIVRAVSDQSRKVKDICTELSMTASTFSKYRERLMQRGIMISPQYGFIMLSLPRFSVFAEAYE